MQPRRDFVQITETGWQPGDCLIILIQLINLRHSLIQHIFDLFEAGLIAVLRDIHNLALGVFN